jgi:hypothetical protein
MSLHLCLYGDRESKICHELDRVGTGGMAWPQAAFHFSGLLACQRNRLLVLHIEQTEGLYPRRSCSHNHCALSILRLGSTFEYSGTNEFSGCTWLFFRISRYR